MLDQTVERNKNLKDAHIVENWIRKSHEILERHELDPLPDSFLQTVPSETGTDNSAAMTSEHLHYDQQVGFGCLPCPFIFSVSFHNCVLTFGSGSAHHEGPGPNFTAGITTLALDE